MSRLLCIALSLLAFAGNSLFTRAALSEPIIDPSSYTLIRLTSGAIALLALGLLLPKKHLPLHAAPRKEDPQKFWLLHDIKWASPIALFIYSYGFSIAYQYLDAGMGALILFGAVQCTVIFAGAINKETFGKTHMAGLTIALAGLIYLLWPDEPAASSAPLWSKFVMLSAGVSWGLYTLYGRQSVSAIRDTRYNFALAALGASLLYFTIVGLSVFTEWNGTGIHQLSFVFSEAGIIYALCSGIICSALGYSIWYLVAPSLSRLQSGTLQLLVPVIAAALGALFLSEVITDKLVISAFIISAGVLLTLRS